MSSTVLKSMWFRHRCSKMDSSLQSSMLHTKEDKAWTLHLYLLVAALLHPSTMHLSSDAVVIFLYACVVHKSPDLRKLLHPLTLHTLLPCFSQYTYLYGRFGHPGDLHWRLPVLLNVGLGVGIGLNLGLSTDLDISLSLDLYPQ